MKLQECDGIMHEVSRGRGRGGSTHWTESRAASVLVSTSPLHG